MNKESIENPLVNPEAARNEPKELTYEELEKVVGGFIIQPDPDSFKVAPLRPPRIKL